MNGLSQKQEAEIARKARRAKAALFFLAAIFGAWFLWGEMSYGFSFDWFLAELLVLIVAAGACLYVMRSNIAAARKLKDADGWRPSPGDAPDRSGAVAAIFSGGIVLASIFYFTTGLFWVSAALMAAVVLIVGPRMVEAQVNAPPESDEFDPVPLRDWLVGGVVFVFVIGGGVWATIVVMDWIEASGMEAPRLVEEVLPYLVIAVILVVFSTVAWAVSAWLFPKAGENAGQADLEKAE